MGEFVVYHTVMYGCVAIAAAAKRTLDCSCDSYTHIHGCIIHFKTLISTTCQYHKLAQAALLVDLPGRCTDPYPRPVHHA